MTQETLPDLPFELIVTILMFLPAESLIRFMCVSKAWYALICSGKFIHKHLQVMTSRGNGYVLCGPTKVCSPGKSSNLLCAKNPSFALKKGIPSKFDSTYCVHVCSSSGLVCLSDADKFGALLYLWNPCIRKFKCITSSSININRPNSYSSFLVLGFGYLSQTNEYKIVRLAYAGNDDFRDEYNDYMDEDYYDDEIAGGDNEITEMEIDEQDLSVGEVEVADESSTTEVEVYSLSTDSWRKIEIQSFPWFLCDNFSRAFVNNCVHWMVYYSHIDEDEQMILSFDLEKEIFQQIRLPYYDNDLNEHVESIVYKDALGFVVIYSMERTEFFSLWVMKEYGVAESWSKLFNVEVGGTIYKPVTLTKNDQIMFKGENKEPCLFNYQSQEIETIKSKFDANKLDFLPVVDSLTLLEPKLKCLDQGSSSYYPKEDNTSPKEQISAIMPPVKDASMSDELDETDSLILLEPKEKSLEEGRSSVGFYQEENNASSKEQMFAMLPAVKDTSMGKEFGEKGCCSDVGSKLT